MISLQKAGTRLTKKECSSICDCYAFRARGLNFLEGLSHDEINLFHKSFSGKPCQA